MAFFHSFAKKHALEIYYTGSETKSAVAERYIRTLKSIICRYLHEHDTNRYIDQLGKFLSIRNNRINRITKLAAITVSQKDVPYLVSLCNTVPPQRPKFTVGKQDRIRRKIGTFHRGNRIQFTEGLFTISHITTKNPSTYGDVNDKIIEGKFYQPELVNLSVPH